MLIRRRPKSPCCMTPSDNPRRCTKIGAMPLSSSMAANAFCSTLGTIRTSLSTTRKQRESTSLNWISWSCRTAMGSHGRVDLPLKRESQSDHLRAEGRLRRLRCGLTQQLLSERLVSSARAALLRRYAARNYAVWLGLAQRQFPTRGQEHANRTEHPFSYARLR